MSWQDREHTGFCNPLRLTNKVWLILKGLFRAWHRKAFLRAGGSLKLQAFALFWGRSGGVGVYRRESTNSSQRIQALAQVKWLSAEVPGLW